MCVGAFLMYFKLFIQILVFKIQIILNKDISLNIYIKMSIFYLLFNCRILRLFIQFNVCLYFIKLQECRVLI